MTTPEKPRRATLEEAERAAQTIARRIKADMPAGWGYLLFLCSFGRDGQTTYMSSVERTDAIRLVQEWVAYITPTVPTSEFVDNTDLSCWCCGERKDLATFRGRHRSVQLCRDCLCSAE